MPDTKCEDCGHFGCSINLYGVGQHKVRGVGCGDERCCDGQLDDRNRGYKRDEAAFTFIDE